MGCSSVSGPSILNNSVEILLLVCLNPSPVDVVVDVLEVEGGDSVGREEAEDVLPSPRLT